MQFHTGRIGLLLVLAGAPAGALAAGAASDNANAVEEVIVTGTRTTGMRAVDSPAPIELVGAAALERTGAPGGLSQALAARLPTLNTQAIGDDMANETLSARLRGLSPNHALVLINGKRRHGTANLAVLAGVFQGGAAADLNLIPAAAIDHVEVLQDGAAAQYGSDAIAGVVNIILKSNASGGSAALTGGAYGKGDGETAVAEANFGLQPGSRGFLNLSVETRFHDYSNRGGPDQRVVRAVDSGAHPDWAQLEDYPYVNKIFGDARVLQALASFNAGVDVSSSAQAYAFGTFGRKHGLGWANFRLPTKLPALHPNGFNPIDELQERDFALTGGVRGEAAGWRWDLSSTYGRDHGSVDVTHSANIDLFNDTGSTPSDFHAGDFIAGQWTNTVDLARDFEIGAGRTATFALGAEHRAETYEIKAGDPPSRYKAGSQSYPGFSLTDAGNHSRHNLAAYADLSITPVERLVLDVAGRWEHFSDFGDTTVGKITGRYDLTPAFGIRGTASTGFRAPTLAEEFYSATNVQPNSAFVQLPPNAPAARLIGIDPLQPEKSTNYSAGVVTHLASAVVTLDVYQIRIRNRVVGSGTLYGTYGGVLRSPEVNLAIVANGNVLENVPFSGINVFSNGIDTRTNGAELVATFVSDMADKGSIDWTFAANYNTTKVTHVKPTPAPIAASGQSLFDKVAISVLETASPKYKLVAGGLWRSGRWSLDLRETFYGASSQYIDPGDGNLYLARIKPKGITDVEASYALSRQVTASLGAQNLFNVYPDKIPAAAIAASGAAGNPAIDIYPRFSPIGINGGFYYGRLSYRF